MPPSPLTTTLIQSTILNAISNVLAQIIDQYKNNKGEGFNLKLNPLLQFIIYAIIIVPINVSWQKYVEARFPGFPSWNISSSSNITGTSSSAGSGSVKGPVSGKVEGDVIISIREKEKEKEMEKGGMFQPKKKSSGLWNFAMKFILDQTVGSVMNIVLFIVLINLLKGMSLHRVWGLVGEDLGPIMIARLYYRPLVSILMYTVVPLDRRVVFGSACGVIWGVYLSLYAAV
ncbi:hypothetical protein BDV25DRAFT_160662 [Aspergillus avenaceus]|uniref:Uncharacterized protein n=1 Tax=Aspergillus avenaceus TaxID=36643 RepID=A0A5N6TLU0_ASPAV|nr:hypothetical protein BDV25DRAFT_160662 [Aspergillus avenaceus]